jgi:hypothetical protein
VNESQDQLGRRKRKRKSGELSRKRLKDDAYPTLLMPSTLLKHVSPTKAKKRRLESSAPVERRRAQRQLQWNNQEEERAAEDLLEDDPDEIERH